MTRVYDELLADYHELQRSFFDLFQKYGDDAKAARNQGRDEGLEEAAKVAEKFRSDNPHPTVYAAIATYIRAKIGDHGNG